jgi:hypothetical protein
VRIVCSISKLNSLTAAAEEYKTDRTNTGKRVKIAKILLEIHEIRKIVEDDIQVMENSIGKNLASSDIVQ